jgi:hypothetical protein
LLDNIKDYYERARRPLAFGLVALILLAGILPSSAIQLAAILVLLTIVLEVLFEILAVVKAKATVWYRSFNEAVPLMEKEVSERLRANGAVRVRWIGVTMEAGWPIAQNLLLDAINGRSRRLTIELAMLDPASVSVDSTKTRIQATLGSMRYFLDEHGDRLVATGCDLIVYCYAYRPTWHALLIDEDLLFFSLADPTHFSLSSPQGGAELVRAGGGPEDSARIAHFKAWFADIVSNGAVFRSA